MLESGVLMSSIVFKGIFLPLLGTTLGSACVFFMNGALSKKLERALLGFAAGVMIAASVWSLIIPAINQSEGMGFFSFVPAVAGFWIGVIFLLALDRLIPHLHLNTDSPEGPQCSLKKNSMLVLAVVLHNLPEGMAVGVVLASLISGRADISAASVITLAVGIAIQNFPEGSIISMPLAAGGERKPKAFLYGFLSGIVEPIGAILTIIFAQLVTPILPYMLTFAAGAMVFVVVEELIPEMSEGEHSDIGTIMFMAGFTLMMALDVALG